MGLPLRRERLRLNDLGEGQSPESLCDTGRIHYPILQKLRVVGER
jgi:hypothetical protein